MAQSDSQPPEQAIPAIGHAMSVWIEDVATFQSRNVGDTKILQYTLSNGIKFVLPLSGQLLAATQKAVSPVVIAGADSLPNGGHGA